MVPMSDPVENPAAGLAVEVILGTDIWLPAVITRGPFTDEGIEYWEVEVQEPGRDAYLTARTVAEMRQP
jgi:hypothetical protein